MTAIVARDLGKGFGARPVLHGLALSVASGSIYGLLGRNGAGKTTLLRLTVGLSVPDTGAVRVLGRDPIAGGDASVGYVAERGLLPGWMRVGDLIGFERSARPRLATARLDAYLAREGIRAGSAVRTLSKGQRKRIELELALAVAPRALVLDEPFDGLDPVSRAEAMEGVVACAEAGAAVVVSSHVLTDLERLCDRIGVMSGGRIAFESDLDDLKTSVALVSAPPSVGDRLPVEVDVIGARSDDRGTTWLVRGVGPAAEDRLRRAHYQVRRPGLDDLGTELLRCLDASGRPS